MMGHILTTNAFLPLLKKGNLKKVLNISSGLGIAEVNLQSEFPAHASYCVSKCALEMVNVKYARERQHHKVFSHPLTLFSSQSHSKTKASSSSLSAQASSTQLKHLVSSIFTFTSLPSLTLLSAPPEAMVEIQKQAASFLKIYPDWTGPISPPESVGLVLGVLDNAKPEDTGKFLSHHVCFLLSLILE